MKHLAIIMDGNARWAVKNGVPKAMGHQQGAETAKKLMPEFIKFNIQYVTLYAFSSENWQRPADEISCIMKLLSYYVEHEVKILHKNHIRLKVIGDLSKINVSLQQKIVDATKLTQDNDKLTLCIAIGYGSRAEIVHACQKMIEANVKQVSEDNFKNFLYDPQMPEVDLLIRPSGVYRMSNFLLWQAAYAELYFVDKFWPDFSIDDIKAALKDYATRKRSFGGR